MPLRLLQRHRQRLQRAVVASPLVGLPPSFGSPFAATFLSAAAAAAAARPSAATAARPSSVLSHATSPDKNATVSPQSPHATTAAAAASPAPHQFILSSLRRRLASNVSSSRMYSTTVRGSLNTPDFRIYHADGEGVPISAMHDIPQFADEAKKIFNMVVEVPRWTNAKMEISLKDALNPIKQDVKKGKLRYVANCFPHHGYIWNYGAIPQTWEDPEHVDESTGCAGDGDPIDVCEIGARVHERGAVVPVKVLGALAMIDEGETDWKIIAIDAADPIADALNDVADIEREMPGFLAATVEWFTVYKIPDGKPANTFAFNGEVKGRDFAVKVIEQCHQQWVGLMSAAEVGAGVAKACTGGDYASKITAEEAGRVVADQPSPGEPGPVDAAAVDKWHYVTAK